MCPRPALNLPPELARLARRYRLIADTEGMSPARVYRLVSDSETLYLKVSDARFCGTTYDVEREKDVLLWLKGKLLVPEVLHFEQQDGVNYLLMSAVRGHTVGQFYEKHRNPEQIIHIYSEAIRLLQSLDIANCPFESQVDFRLRELDYLLRNGLADVDTAQWEDDTPFRDPAELYAFLQANKSAEDLVFSHGDLGESNLFVHGNQISGLIDWGRGGKADRWLDIAFCVRSIRNDLGGQPEHLALFFELLDLTPDWERIRYYILLDEMF